MYVREKMKARRAGQSWVLTKPAASSRKTVVGFLDGGDLKPDLGTKVRGRQRCREEMKGHRWVGHPASISTRSGHGSTTTEWKSRKKSSLLVGRINSPR